jgi:mannose-1-phosphate guanylyltransferase
MNKGTAPPIVHSLMSIAQIDRQALVAILPCDHYFSDETAFDAALDTAFEAAAEQPHSVILLGARPEYPEIEYGWIELGVPLEGGRSELFRVRGFHEKPKSRVASTLFEQGALWNTFVMVGHVQAFLDMVRARVPELLEQLGQARSWAGQETHIEYSLYLHLSASSFSHGVLSAESERLRALRLNGAGWSDLGDLARVTSVILESGSRPEWFERWVHVKGAASDTQCKSAIA